MIALEINLIEFLNITEHYTYSSHKDQGYFYFLFFWIGQGPSF